MSHPLAALACQLGHALDKHHYKLATAESCTGGGLGYWITSIAGSSAWYDRGFITYSNESKITLLDVSPATLAAHGAVSQATALEMASGALVNSEAHVSIAITGIAGPSGGTPEKPVGTVWIGIGIKQDQIRTYHEQLNGDRETIREEALRMAILHALNLLS